MSTTTIEAGVRELSLAHVGVTKKGGLCALTQPIEISKLHGDTDLIKTAGYVEHGRGYERINRMPNSIMLNGKKAGVCKWGGKTQDTSDPIDTDYTKLFTKTGVTKGSVYTSYLNTKIDGFKNAKAEVELDDVRRKRLLRSSNDNYRRINRELDEFCEHEIPIDMLKPLKTTDKYDSLEIIPIVGNDTNCSEWTENTPKYVCTETVNGDVMPQFYGGVSSIFSEKDRAAEIIMLSPVYFHLLCCDRIGYFITRENQLYYCRFQGTYDIVHMRYGVSLQPTKDVTSNFDNDVVGPIWPGDALVLRSEVGRLLNDGSEISFSFK